MEYFSLGFQDGEFRVVDVIFQCLIEYSIVGLFDQVDLFRSLCVQYFNNYMVFFWVFFF